VVRDLGTLVLGPGLPAEVEALAEERNTRIVRAEPDLGVPLAARGAFQRHNFAVAAAAAEAFLGRELEPEAVRAAAADTVVRGRMEVVADSPLVIHDGAHNAHGAAALADALPEVVGDRRVVGVVSILDDKDAAAMLGVLLPLFDDVVFTRSSNPRALSPATLAHLAGRPEAEAVGEPHAAVARASEMAGRDGAVLVTGSIYLIADLVREPGAARASMI
jgi:dihydrofolate synthase/folylpolyglutamate synthase